MTEVVEMGRATQDELRGELSELFRGAIRLTLERARDDPGAPSRSAFRTRA